MKVICLFFTLMFVTLGTVASRAHAQAQSDQGADAEPYPNMPSIPPIGVRTAKYWDVPAAARGEAVDPAKGYRIQKLGAGLYMITDNQIQSMFMVYDRGVVVLDAPQSLAAHIKQAIAEVTDKPITHLIYSHSHADHIGGAKQLGRVPTIIAHEETLRLLERDADPNRPLPTLTFKSDYSLKLGDQVLQLSYHGPGHEPGNIFIYAPKQRVLMAIDLVFPGWIPWRRFAVAHDIIGVFAQVEQIRKLDWDIVVGGHVERVGTHADVEAQAEFYRDIKQAAATALSDTKVSEGMNPEDKNNAWAVFDNYIDRVALQCVNALTPKWSSKLAAFDVFIWDQCYSMEQSLRID